MSKKFLKIPIRDYVFILLEEAQKFEGYYTEDLCECNLLYLVSDKGYAAAHYYKSNDINDLFEKIKFDFQGAKRIEAVLIGGFFNDVASPWKIKKKIFNKKVNELEETQVLEKIKNLEDKVHAINQRDFIPIKNYVQKNIKQEFLKCKKNIIPNHNLFSIDFDLFEEKLKSKNLSMDINENIDKKIRSPKNFLGYQNTMKLVDMIYKLQSYLNINVTLGHYFCENNSHIKIFFASSDIKNSISASEKKESEDNLILLKESTRRIARANSYYPVTNLKKTKCLFKQISSGMQFELNIKDLNQKRKLDLKETRYEVMSKVIVLEKYNRFNTPLFDEVEEPAPIQTNNASKKQVNFSFFINKAPVRLSNYTYNNIAHSEDNPSNSGECFKS